MSRLGNKLKGGAYPLDADWRPLLWRLFKPFEPGKGRKALILDPFFNEGDTVLLGAGMLNMEPYGVEIQTPFIPKARENLAEFYTSRGMTDHSLTRLLHEDAFKMEASNGAFSIVYCNPPYDETIIDDPERHRGSYSSSSSPFARNRMELEALRRTFRYVSNGGYMVFVCYSQHLTRPVAEEFQKNCNRVTLLRFPELHLDRYTQVVVIGEYIKGHKNEQDVVKREQAILWMMDQGKNPEKILDIEQVVDRLEQKQSYLFSIAPCKQHGLILFNAKEVDPNILLEQHSRYGAHTLPAFAKLLEPPQDDPPEQPLHPPNKRQMVVNIASGMLDMLEIVRNGKRALLRGSIQPERHKIAEETETVNQKEGDVERTKQTYLIRPGHHIILLYEDGTIEDLSDTDQLTELIEANGELLLSTFQQRYKPFYDMYVHPVWKKLLKQLKFGGKGMFMPAQRYWVVCTTEHLAIRWRQIINAQMGTGKTGVTGATMIALRLLQAAIDDLPKGRLPKIAKQFGIKRDELISLVDSICERYDVSVSDLMGIPTNQPVIITCPAIAPSIWMDQEITPMWSGFKPVQLRDTSEAEAFMKLAAANEEDDQIYLGVISYESAKAIEGIEPAAMPSRRYSKSRDWDLEKRQYVNHLRKDIKAVCPVTGGIVTDHKGMEVPFKRFTKTDRSKRLFMFESKVLWGYKPEEFQDEKTGQKVIRVIRDEKHRLMSRVVNRPLTKDEIARNQNLGYPYHQSIALPMYSQIRSMGLPKIGNGRALTPEKEVTIPGRIIRQLRFTTPDGYRTNTPYLQEVMVPPMTILVKDYAKQKNLLPGEPITDPWLASMGVRCFDSGGKHTAIDRLMREYKLDYYRTGGGRPTLDKELQKKGISEYYSGIGQKTLRNPKYPIAHYLRLHWKDRIALFVADEIHAAKSPTSEVGFAFRDLCNASMMVLGLTGTLYGGKASSVFALEYEFNDWVRKNYHWTRGVNMQWVEDMGVLKEIVTIDRAMGGNSIRSGIKQKAPAVSEAPGASPKLMRVLSPHTLWASLYDLRGRMPKKTELSYQIQLSEAMQMVYSASYKTIRDYNARRITSGDRSFLGMYYISMLFLCDAMHRDQPVVHRITADKDAARRKVAGEIPVCKIPSLGPELRPKEQEVMKFLKEDLADERRIIISLEQTGSRDIRDRWFDIINENVPKAKIFILKDSVQAAKRSAYIKQMAKDGYNVMITNGGLITTAISLNEFSAFYNIEFGQNLYKFSQANARINRPNQEREDIVYRHFYYAEHFQQQAVENVADKMKAASVLAGAEGGGDLSALMGSEDRVPSYEFILKAIEGGSRQKTAEEIQQAFNAANFNGNYEDSAWYVPGDEDEEVGEFYAETEVEVEIDNDDDVVMESEE